jgi:hypothetical protein
LPVKGKLGFGLTMAGSIALDTLATTLNAKSVMGMKGTRLKRAKVFGEQQVVGTGIGYGVFGASLLVRKDIRGKMAGLLSRFSPKNRNLPVLYRGKK